MELKDLLKGQINTSFSKTVKRIGNFNLTGMVGAIASVYEELTSSSNKAPVLVLCADSFDAQAIRATLFSLLPKVKIDYFSDYETLPYDTLSPHEDIISSRIELLA